MKPSITVVSLGPGDPGLLTLQGADALRHARRLILRTARHRAVAWLQEQGVAFEALDDYYDRFDDFDEMHRAMAAYLWREAAKGPVTFAVIDLMGDESVRALRDALPEGAKLDVLPGVSMADRCLAQLPLRHAGRVRVIPAVDADQTLPDPSTPLLITELWHPALAGDVKLWLTDLYSDEMEIVLFPSSAQAGRRPLRIPLMELDRQHAYDHTVCAYVPAAGLMERDRFCFGDLIGILRTLRGPGGCPWDRRQTHDSLRRHLIEEAWEAVAAIDADDPDQLADELGDVLFQVAIHTDIARDHGEFAIGDVTSAICRKMISRHPHVFGDGRGDSPEEVFAHWEQRKMQEKGLDTHGQALADVPRALPALMRAAKVQKKAAEVGFGWDDPAAALPGLREAADELLAALQARPAGDGSEIARELGELLFACVHVARLCGVDPESALHSAAEKFIFRFSNMENAIISDGKALKDLTLAEMDVYWNKVKALRPT